MNSLNNALNPFKIKVVHRRRDSAATQINAKALFFAVKIFHMGILESFSKMQLERDTY